MLNKKRLRDRSMACHATHHSFALFPRCQSVAWHQRQQSIVESVRNVVDESDWRFNNHRKDIITVSSKLSTGNSSLQDFVVPHRQAHEQSLLELLIHYLSGDKTIKNWFTHEEGRSFFNTIVFFVFALSRRILLAPQPYVTLPNPLPTSTDRC